MKKENLSRLLAWYWFLDRSVSTCRRLRLSRWSWIWTL